MHALLLPAPLQSRPSQTLHSSEHAANAMTTQVTDKGNGPAEWHGCVQNVLPFHALHPGCQETGCEQNIIHDACACLQIGMEMWARWAHKALWHDFQPGWGLHKSHHEKRIGPFEANDVFAVINAVPAMGLCAYGFLTPGSVGGLCFGAGLGITIFGICYMFVHDGLVHKRFPTGPIAQVSPSGMFDHPLLLLLTAPRLMPLAFFNQHCHFLYASQKPYHWRSFFQWVQFI